MKFGAFDHIDAGGVSLRAQYEGRFELAEIYEKLGYHAYHIAEHHSTPLGVAPSPNLILAALTQRTKTLRFGPLVSILPLYHPVRLLEEICMLDHMSGGRLELGVGRGAAHVEHARFGVAQDDIQPMFDEALDFLLQGLNAGDTFSFEGKYYQVKDLVMTVHPLQQPHPRLWYGTNTPEKTVWGAKNNINMLSLAPAALTRQVSDRYHEEWKKLGRPQADMPFMGIARNVIVAETDEEARRIGMRAWGAFARHLSWLWERDGVEFPVKAWNHDFDKAAANGSVIAGSPETVRAKIAQLKDEARINYLAAELVFGDMSLEEAKTCAELFGRHVIPAFAKAPVAA
jgi:alkanesulfonate monooxygenase SsuD/methylene tetrahydromethanopterin reductase-like flavin-dependent oxidoreductase (luciferase family)